MLLYHSIGSTPWAVAEESFRQQLDWLRANCKIVGLERLTACESESVTQVAITFDDGYASLYERVAPIFRELDIAGTVYLSTGWIGNTDRKCSDPGQGHYPEEEFLTWKEVESLLAQGWTIGSHGVDHLDLTTTSSGIAERELAESRQDIETRLRCECRHFAYTWGKHTGKLRSMVAAAGYRCAVAAYHAPIKSTDDQFALPRLNIAADYSMEDFKAIVRGDWNYLGWIHKFRMFLQ